MTLKSGAHLNRKLLIRTRHTRVFHNAESSSGGSGNSRVSQRDADAASNRPGPPSVKKEFGDKPGLQMCSTHIHLIYTESRFV